MEAAQAGGGGGIPLEEEKKLVETFCSITSSSREEAVFFLESHNWQLDVAVHSFFDNDDSPRHQPAAATASTDNRRRQPRLDQEEEDEGGEEEEDDDEDYIPPRDISQSRPTTRATAPPASSIAMSSRDKKPSNPSGSRPSGGIRTLADLNRGSGHGSDSDDSDGPPEYYTGGEKSGMLVQDPSKGSHDADAIFEQVRQMGATQGPTEPIRPSSSSRSFTGTGRLLSGETVQSASQQPENAVHNVVFWLNGFTINDGPLRRFDDPENASFLESIRKSECPKELEPPDRKSAVHVTLTKREEKWPEPVKRHNPFQGVGRTLGGESSTNPVSPVPPVPTTDPISALSTSVGLSVDASLPSTSIQLRLADGTRMVARFNNHHTVGDIRSFIDASRPGATRSYWLQTVGFPPKQLSDATQTIERAGLANSVVIQKL